MSNAKYFLEAYGLDSEERIYDKKDDSYAISDLLDGYLKESTETFEQKAKLLIKHLCDNYNPHAIIIITCNSAEILQGVISINTNEFIKD